MQSINVAKFGGTSVADYQAMCRCADIVLNNENTRVVVVSASAGVTNHLVRLTQTGLEENEREAILQHISDIEFSIVKALNPEAEVNTALSLLLDELFATARDPVLATSLLLKDKLLAFGERMSSLLFAALLRKRGASAINFEVGQVLKTDSRFGQAEPQLDQIKQQAQTLLKPELGNSIFVTQGFIGADNNNQTTTLGRGGSDYSAALLAEALEAEVLEIWTDVIGIYTTDPRITDRAQPIPEISFDEAAEMATFGAKILHPATLIPAMRQQTRVFVGSSRAPEQGGTWISRQVENKPAYRAIALRREQVLVTIKSPDMLHATGFLAEVFAVLAKYKISVDLITTSEISVALTLDNSQLLNAEIIAELEAVSHGQVNIEKGLSLVAVIGNHFQDQKGISGDVLSALQQYNLRMICHGASQHNLCFLVEQTDDETIVEHLHKVLL